MDDDTSYYSFSTQSQNERQQISRHKRRQSLLKQPNEDVQSDGRLTDDNANIFEANETPKEPLNATTRRRAQSYSDLLDAARAVLGGYSTAENDTKKAEGNNIKSELDFVDWYHRLEQGLLDSSQDEYTSYQDQLDVTQSHLDSLLSSTDSTVDILASLSKSFKAVEAQTMAFQKQCEELLSEQKRLTEMADGIGRNVQYYTYLEPITKSLNAPGAGNFVRGKEFSDMLARLDQCLEYMAVHPSHRESFTYKSRYRLLMTRALTLIRVNFVGALRDIASDVTKRIADRQLNDTTMSALLYAKFRVGASELKEVGREIQKRAIRSAGAEPGAKAEYQSLMNELYTSYAATRGKLVIPLIRKKIADIAMAPSTSKDLITFARSSIGYVRGICSDEYELWREWFDGEDGLYDFLESVCEPLYDHLRPRTIHENQLLKLCDLCTLLQTRYIRDPEEEVEPLEAIQVDFSVLIQPALEDAQTRLVFRAQTIMRDEIERYKPKPEDLDYPARNRLVSLSGTKSNAPITSGREGSVAEPTTPMPQTPMIVDEGDSPSGRELRWGLDTEAALEGWYPTLRKAIWLLSRIYRLVNSTVFDDLAHQIVHQTTLSLYQAATQISSKATNVDGQLFLIKHLLILKQQIVAFDIEYVTPDVSFDFSGVTNTFWELRERGGLFDPRNLWRFMGGGLLPRVVENMLDAKAELDGRLRTVIKDFTNTFASRMTAAISQSAASKRSFNGGSAVRTVQELAGKEVSVLRGKLDQYLDDFRTKETLVRAVQEQVIQNYETFYDRYEAEKRSSGKAVSKKGKGREDEVWDSDTFAEWTDSVFGVSGLGVLGTDHGSRSRSESLSGSV
ncbi:MAG: sec34-like family [Lasallia pustulata]|uniref:Conserved oligomeric Golgi complex subunit 3 n=1 Tax=Lasallia pustulata TaxID=136370 RepID=A0A5M8PJG0_9LECA|nr:MAG: sec34-like family [Lasallia pustulata]